MTRSFSSLCITNAICLTSLWILIALGIYVAKMQRDQDIHDLSIKMRWYETGIIDVEEDNFYYLRVLSMETISKSLIWLGFVLDSVVCFTEFMVVWLKVQAPPAKFYLLSVGRYLTYSTYVFNYYDIKAENYSPETITFLLVFYAFCRIVQALVMCFMNKKLSNKVDGIIIPVVYAVGPTGKKAMAGA